MNTVPREIAQPGYEDDFVLWIEAQVQLLRNGDLYALDIDNLCEELEGMARSEKRGISSRLEVLLEHLLKYQFQETRRSRSWLSTILEQRHKIAERLADSPSLRRQLPARLENAYRHAIKLAEIETGITAGRFPQHCPYTLEQVLDEDFLPAR